MAGNDLSTLEPVKRTQVNDDFEAWCDGVLGYLPIFGADGKYYSTYRESVQGSHNDEWQHRWEGWQGAVGSKIG